MFKKTIFALLSATFILSTVQADESISEEQKSEESLLSCNHCKKKVKQPEEGELVSFLSCSKCGN